MNCDRCGLQMREQPQFEGLFICDQCDGLNLTPEGARDFHIELCRAWGRQHNKQITSDQIIESWNLQNPGDEW